MSLMISGLSPIGVDVEQIEILKQEIDSKND